MTDARFGNDLLPAIQRLPAKSGVIFRHYHLDTVERRALFRQVLRVCRRRGHMLLLAGDERTALRWHADGFHQRTPGRTGLVQIAPVHNMREIMEAKAYVADLLLLSPLFATNSHPDQRPLGSTAFHRLAKLSGPERVIALGGVNRRNANLLSPQIVYGWAGIDAFRKSTA